MSEDGEHPPDGRLFDEPVTGGRLVGGRYRLADRIGSGPAGTVWRALDERERRYVAVKEPLLPGDPDDPEDEERRRTAHRLYREARAAARVHHPSAVTIHEVVPEDGLPWIVMELIEGESLDEALRRDTLAPAEAARVGLAVLGALRAAHAVGIVHRDIKPANVLLESGTDRVVLTDFGIGDAHTEEAHAQEVDAGEAHAEDVDTRGAESRGAGLEGAESRGAGLEGAVSRGAGLRGAGLEGAVSRGAGLRGAGLEGAESRSAVSRGGDSGGVILEGADSRGAGSEGVDSRSAVSRGAGSEGVDSRGAVSEGAVSGAGDSRGVGSEGADSRRAVSRGADWRGAGSTGAGLESADAAGDDSEGVIPADARGSVAFVAPERASGRGAGPASDLWSLGALLRAAVGPGRAGPLEPVLARLLAPEPEARPDAEETAALLGALAGIDVSPREPKRAPAPEPAPATTDPEAAGGEPGPPPAPRPATARPRRRTPAAVLGLLLAKKPEAE
ncbi:protein kinase [Streptomyces sp. NPDC006739]|uniref:protein kinase domain-containing protein n=1 Tax=Streptomyces sp. NPDC006739 TaxID=3364763 RepID=UPI00368D7082